MSTWPSPCMQVPVQVSPFYQVTSHTGWGPTLICNLITVVKTCLQIKSHSEVLGFRTQRKNFFGGGTQFNPYTPSVKYVWGNWGPSQVAWYLNLSLCDSEMVHFHHILFSTHELKILWTKEKSVFLDLNLITVRQCVMIINCSFWVWPVIFSMAVIS